MNNEIMLIFSFDMETDLGSFTPFYKGVKLGTPKILDLLSKKGIQATFFFTGETAKLHPQIVKNIRKEGHEIGCHTLYHETVGNELFPIPGVKPLLPEEVPLRLKIATEYVEDVLEDKVVSFRAPRLWGSTEVVNALENLGYIADVTYPLYYYMERLVPYHPNRNDWTKEGDMKILEIPNFADVTLKSKDPYGRNRDQWPLFRTEGSEKLAKHIENFIQYVRDKSLPAVICFYFHPWEFIEMPTGLIHYGEGSVLPDEFITRNCGEYALRELGKLIDTLKSAGGKCYTVKALAKVWK